MLHCNFRSLPRDALRSFGSNFTRFYLSAPQGHRDPKVRRSVSVGLAVTAAAVPEETVPTVTVGVVPRVPEGQSSPEARFRLCSPRGPSGPWDLSGRIP